MASVPAPASEAAISPAIDRKVEAEMTRMLYGRPGSACFRTSPFALILVAGAFNTSRRPACPVARRHRGRDARAGCDGHRFRSAQSGRSPTAGLAKGVFRQCGHRRLIWGSRGLALFSNTLFLPRLLLVFILAGLNAGAARSLASVPWSYRLYVISTLSPLLARFLTLPEAGTWTLGLDYRHLRALSAEHRPAAPQRSAPAVAADF